MLSRTNEICDVFQLLITQIIEDANLAIVIAIFLLERELFNCFDSIKQVGNNM